MSFFPKVMNPLRFWILLSLMALAIPAAALGWFAFESFSSGFSAKGEPSAIEVWVARQVRHWAIPKRMRDTPNPIAASPMVIEEGLAHFADHCASCHANDGSGKTPIGQNLYPKAPDLRAPATQSMSDGELFFTIHYGIRLTGMPAWGKGPPQNDQDSWKLVHFIRHLPNLSQEELARMKTLNPISRHELAQEEEFERFLLGEDVQGSASTHSH